MQRWMGVIASFAMLVFLAGCETTNWAKAGGNHSQYAKDVTECASKGELPVVAPGDAPVAGMIVPYAYEAQKVFEKCMVEKGYKKL